MSNTNVGQNVECDQCTWKGTEIELQEEIENGNTFRVCPECGEESISHMGHD
jgi:predicted RNA-binding Zn-ribbon protein involved in translation (DUF1610 family)